MNSLQASHTPNVARRGDAGLTQWGSSWPRERVCGRGGIRRIVEICGKGKYPTCKTRHMGHPAHRCKMISLLFLMIRSEKPPGIASKVIEIRPVFNRDSRVRPMFIASISLPATIRART